MKVYSKLVLDIVRSLRKDKVDYVPCCACKYKINCKEMGLKIIYCSDFSEKNNER